MRPLWATLALLAAAAAVAAAADPPGNCVVSIAKDKRDFSSAPVLKVCHGGVVSLPC